MSIIALPDNNFRSVNWTLVQPTQVNRSEFTSARQAMQLPGASYFKASAEHVPIVGEANIRAWRAFFAKLGGQANTFRLPATDGAQQSTHRIAALGLNVGLAASGGVSVSGRTITKTGGVDGAWDASARTTGANGFTGGARIAWRIGDVSKRFLMGLSADSTISDANDTIDYALYNDLGTLRAVELGTSVAAFGTVTADDILAITYQGTTLSYWRNEERLAQRTTTAGRSFYADSSFFNAGAQALDVFFSGDAGTYGIDAGDTTLPLTGFAAGQTDAVEAGWYATALFYDGGSQLLTITDTADADGSGNVTANLHTMLRGQPFALITGEPWCLMAVDDPQLGYSVDPGAVYGFGISATEAF